MSLRTHGVDGGLRVVAFEMATRSHEVGRAEDRTGARAPFRTWMLYGRGPISRLDTNYDKESCLYRSCGPSILHVDGRQFKDSGADRLPNLTWTSAFCKTSMFLILLLCEIPCSFGGLQDLGELGCK